MLIKKKYRLIPITPVHVGSKEGILTRLSFEIIDGRCYMINEDRLAEKLLNLGLVEEFSERVKDRSFSLMNFLEQKFGKGRAKQIITECSSYYSVCTGNFSQLRPFIRDPFFRPYVPGSSIKGAIRNALYYVILKRSKTAKEELEKYISSHSQKSKKGFSSEFHLLDDFKFGNKIRSPNTDILRALKITDSIMLDKNSLQVYPVKVIGTRKNLVQLVETLSQPVEFEITIDESILQDFLKTGKDIYGISVKEITEMIKAPFSITKEFAEDLYRYHKKTGFERYLPFSSEEVNFRIGWGGGIMGITVDMHFADSPTMRVISKMFKRTNPYNFPKTRRVVEVDKECMLGWCRVEEVKA